MLGIEIEGHDPAYDSAEELFENAFGSKTKNTKYDWSMLVELSDEDETAMDEIEVAMLEEWIEKASLEQEEIEDEGETFFSEHAAGPMKGL